MCDFSGRLIAWVDQELPEGEAAETERHLAVCSDCRRRLAAYQQATRAFDAYCDACFAKETRPGLPRWAIAAGGASAMAAAATMIALLLLPHERVVPVPARGATAIDPPHVAAQPAEPSQTGAVAADGPDAPMRPNVRVGGVQPPAPPLDRATRRYAAAAPHTERVSSFPLGPPIEITIPGDAMFPPGAVPPGMSFTADLTLSADGAPERLGLRPRLAGFERRVNQP